MYRLATRLTLSCALSACALPALAQWHSLFNGVDLDGWLQVGPGAFEVDSDSSLNSEGGMGLLYYSEQAFRDFELELEWKTRRPIDNSGVYVRFPRPESPWDAVGEGYEIQIDDSRDPDHVTASIYEQSAPFRDAAHPTGEWNAFRIRVTGHRYQVWLNDIKVNDFVGNRGREGFIGLQNHDDSSRVAFRDVRVRELEVGGPESLAEMVKVDDDRAPIRVLLLTATHGFRHGAAIDAAKEVLMSVAETTEIKVDTTENIDRLNPETLADFDVLFLANSTLRAPAPEGVAQEPEETSMDAWGTVANYNVQLLVPDNTIEGIIRINGSLDSLTGAIRFNLFPAPSEFSEVGLSADSLNAVWDTGGMGVAYARFGLFGDSLSGHVTIGEMTIPASGTAIPPPPVTYGITVTAGGQSMDGFLTLEEDGGAIDMPFGLMDLYDVSTNDSVLAFSFDIDGMGSITGKGKLEGDSITGTMDSAMGPLDFIGTQSSEEPEVFDGPTIEASHMEAILGFLRQGKGVAIAHAGLDALYNVPEYRALVGGGLFESHPWTQSVRISVEDSLNAATRHFEDGFWIRDEIYVLDENPRWNARVLLSLDANSVELTGDSAGDERGDYPISWIRNHNGGRVFATALGHFADVWTTPDFLTHVLEGIRMVAGRTDTDFTGHREKEVIADSVWPDDLAVDEKGNVWIAELRGKVHRYDAESETVTQIAHIATTDPTNIEHGLYGIEVDPDFYNGAPFVYLYYAEPHTFINTLSRFRYADGGLDLDSEQVLLRVPTEPQCCHQGGDLEWHTDHTLLLSTGDTGMSEVRPAWKLSEERLEAFQQEHNLKGYHWSRVVDSERSAQNLQDLRGKILRINRDGSIPADNPFFGTPGVRWEVYAYGLRNPYRFKIDPPTGALYIGVVGPDAGFDYDEYNVSAAGGENFGWPRTLGRLFYNEWTPEMIPNFVPPIWEYTYESGGRSASSASIYRSEGRYAFPALQNKLIVYDWARRWIKYGDLLDGVMESDRDADQRAEVPDIAVSGTRLVNIKTFDTISRTSPISLEVGSDGSIYVAEFDGFWDAGPRSRVTRYRWIEGNRPPIGQFRHSVDNSNPLALEVDGAESWDPDADTLEYQWDFGDGMASPGRAVTHVYAGPGTYTVQLTVRDPLGGESVVAQEVTVGAYISNPDN